MEFEPTAKRSLGVTSREGFLASMVLHLLIFIVLLVTPDVFAPRAVHESQQEKQKPRERLVMVIPPPARPVPVAPRPPAGAPQPAPPQSAGILIPKAVEPPPPDKRPEFQNDLPFSEGNTDEFYTAKEKPKKPGEEGDTATPSSVPTPAPEPERRVAQFPSGVFSFPPVRPRETPRVDPRDPGDNGEGGAFMDLRRFLRDKQFHNPEGGLVTGRNNTLYYNDKGANFVPWLRRMLSEVKRHWLATVPYWASIGAGHVAIGVSVQRDGSISDLKVLVPSQSAGFDNAAKGSLLASQLLPLPSDYPDQQFDFILVFWYNERPYDIFN